MNRFYGLEFCVILMNSCMNALSYYLALTAITTGRRMIYLTFQKKKTHIASLQQVSIKVLSLYIMLLWARETNLLEKHYRDIDEKNLIICICKSFCQKVWQNSLSLMKFLLPESEFDHQSCCFFMKCWSLLRLLHITAQTCNVQH